MFEEVGHFAEKVRRVGFGPLVLDVPPGETRELSEEEVIPLKKASRRRAASIRAASAAAQFGARGSATPSFQTDQNPLIPI